MHIVGEVRDRIAVLIDDMVDTAGTLAAAATALKENGAGDPGLLHPRGSFGRGDFSDPEFRAERIDRYRHDPLASRGARARRSGCSPSRTCWRVHPSHPLRGID